MKPADHRTIRFNIKRRTCKIVITALPHVIICNQLTKITKLISIQGIKIDTTGLEPTQSDTQSLFGPHLAIDGNIYTYAVACNPCSETHKPGLAWWAIHFGTEFAITAVMITSSPTESGLCRSS